MRVVPTADLSATMGLSISVLLICSYYNVKIKGARRLRARAVHRAVRCAPGVLWPFNFLMQIIEFVAKTVSHGMRLFGNMYAGELIFMLIALMGAPGRCRPRASAWDRPRALPAPRGRSSTS